MTDPIKRMRERGFSKALAQSAANGLAERARLVQKNKPIAGLSGIEHRLGDEWFQEQAAARRS